MKKIGQEVDDGGSHGKLLPNAGGQGRLITNVQSTWRENNSASLQELAH